MFGARVFKGFGWLENDTSLVLWFFESTCGFLLEGDDIDACIFVSICNLKFFMIFVKINHCNNS